MQLLDEREGTNTEKLFPNVSMLHWLYFAQKSNTYKTPEVGWKEVSLGTSTTATKNRVNKNALFKAYLMTK